MASTTPGALSAETPIGNLNDATLASTIIEKANSTCLEKQKELEVLPSSERALEAVAPKYDESKILHGRRLFFAFLAMLLSVLLIALGALSFRSFEL
jgi:hypothetical protein